MIAREMELLDPRVWLVWGAAASLPPLLGRNPFALAATMIAVIGVRAAWQGVSQGFSSWRWVIRLAVFFAFVGVIFNVLTYHGGDQKLFRLPDRVPIIGGPLTLNAVIYGVLSGWALLTLVLIGTTVGALIDWPALLRLMPARLTTFAVAGSVAFSFLPQTAVAYREIREAQAIRGHRLAGVRDLPPVIVPLLAGALERSITMAEALESRAFGVPARPDAARHLWKDALAALALALAVSAGFLLASGRSVVALAALGIAVAVFVLLHRGGSALHRTRYRRARWRWADSLAVIAASLATIVVVGVVWTDQAALRYEPYPSLDAPLVNLLLLAGIGLLLVPAFLTPVGQANQQGAWK